MRLRGSLNHDFIKDHGPWTRGITENVFTWKNICSVGAWFKFTGVFQLLCGKNKSSQKLNAVILFESSRTGMDLIVAEVHFLPSSLKIHASTWTVSFSEFVRHKDHQCFAPCRIRNYSFLRKITILDRRPLRENKFSTDLKRAALFQRLNQGARGTHPGDKCMRPRCEVVHTWTGLNRPRINSSVMTIMNFWLHTRKCLYYSFFLYFFNLFFQSEEKAAMMSLLVFLSHFFPFLCLSPVFFFPSLLPAFSFTARTYSLSQRHAFK